ncbi:MAG: hypothetical protein Q9160_008860 [Pyrenula sp. 1 TL-2023]
MLTRHFKTKLCNACQKDLLTFFEHGSSTPQRSRRPILQARNASVRRYPQSRKFVSSRSLKDEQESGFRSPGNHEPANGDSHFQSSEKTRSNLHREISPEEEISAPEDGIEDDSPLLNDDSGFPSPIDPNEWHMALEAIDAARNSAESTIEVARIAFGNRRLGDISSELTNEERILYDQVAEAYDLPGGDAVEAARLGGLGVEEVVKQARNAFGAYVPDHLLLDDELTVYRRLYGEPLRTEARSLREDEDGIEDEVEEADEAETLDPELFQEDSDGALQRVPSDPSSNAEIELQTGESLEDAEPEDEPVDTELDDGLALPPAGSVEEVARLVNGTVSTPDDVGDTEEDDAEIDRMHPLTRLGKWKTPRTLFLPQDSFLTPIRGILRDFSNKHIDEMSERLFGGKGLPHSTSVANPKAAIPQEPIPIDSSQYFMGEMEANAYIAAIMPGTYAALTSILVEVRKRLGTDWIRSLLAMEGGPRILDAGAGGAGIVAIREILKAEHASLNPRDPQKPTPLGKATVLTGSATLRHRASSFLENTTFLPRLPDYVHVRDNPTVSDDRPAPPRKQYDVILAPHSLWSLKEEWQRKQTVQNLWSLLSPDGGVLIILEKGQPRGFEVVAGAREHILERLIQPPNQSLSEQPIDMTDDIRKVPGMIIAPCTNHGKCPMYPVSGISKGRKDFCSFEQRYIRPQFLQRILKAKDRNHEDIKFSYVAVQKGRDLRSDTDNTSPLHQNAATADAAFAGYENLADIPASADLSPSAEPNSPSTPHSISTLALTLPRLIYPPLKRRGHITLDVCTSAARIERWVIPKSFSKVAYRDARKAHWGDLWALGAKTRTQKQLRNGSKKSKEERKEMTRARREEGRREVREAMLEDAEDEDGDEEDEEIEEMLGGEDRDVDVGGGVRGGGKGGAGDGLEDWEREWEAELQSQIKGSKSKVRRLKNRPGREENKFTAGKLQKRRGGGGPSNAAAGDAAAAARPGGRRRTKMV